jgi:hypothetical protein
MIEDNIRHVKKYISWIFHHYFDRVVYLIIKFTAEIQNYIKKFIKYFYTIDCDVHYHLAKSQIKIQLVHGETKKTNWVKG